MKKCLRCNGEVERGAHARNKKYCSTICRSASYQEKTCEKNREYQRRRYQKKIKGKTITCLICGNEYRQVGTHITQVHKITARVYREKYGFDVKRGQLPKDLRKIKAEHVFKNNTIKNLKAGKKYQFKKGQKGIGTYKRSKQTEIRLKKHWDIVGKLGRKKKIK